MNTTNVTNIWFNKYTYQNSVLTKPFSVGAVSTALNNPVSFKSSVGLDIGKRWDRDLVSFMLPWLHVKKLQSHLLYRPRKNPMLSLYPDTLAMWHGYSPVLFYFFLQTLLSSRSDSIWDIWGEKKGWKRLSSLVVRAVFKRWVSCVLLLASVNA